MSQPVRLAETTARASQARVFLAESVLPAMDNAIAPYRSQGHEGVAYLAGTTDGHSTAVLAVLPVAASTTWGSFVVESAELARAVRRAADIDLQIVGQVHSHPREAFHSDGDVEGARIHYPGYVSVVLPEYGDRLPSLDGAAWFIYEQAAGFQEIVETAVRVIPGTLT